MKRVYVVIHCGNGGKGAGECERCLTDVPCRWPNSRWLKMPTAGYVVAVVVRSSAATIVAYGRDTPQRISRGAVFAEARAM